MNVKLVGCGRTVVEGVGGSAQGRVPDLRRGVDADTLRLHDARPLVEGAPAPFLACLEYLSRDLPQLLRLEVPHRERRVAAVPGDLRRHPLVGHALPAGVVEQREVGVGVHVDEPRREDESACVYSAPSFGLAKLTDGGYLPVFEADIRPVTRCVRPVYDRCILDERIEWHS